MPTAPSRAAPADGSLLGRRVQLQGLAAASVPQKNNGPLAALSAEAADVDSLSDAASDNASVVPLVGDDPSIPPTTRSSLTSWPKNAGPEAEGSGPTRSPTGDVASRPTFPPSFAQKRLQEDPPQDSEVSPSIHASPRSKLARGSAQDPAAGRGGAHGPSRASRSDARSARLNKSRAHPRKKSESDQAAARPTSGPIVSSPPRKDDTADARGQVDDGAILLQPETRPISHEQLVVEVRGIYAGLVMVESKCIDVDEKQARAAKDPHSKEISKFLPEQYRALIALHKTLLHEHHDFFLASQHPAASPMLTGLAKKYSMPARLWRHAIYGFLEVLRHRLPDSSDHMLAFIYIAYSMIALLYETALGFESTWIEALGDLSRYRMAIETEDMETRQIWANVSRSWYLKAVDKDPSIGRLQHHLAILEKHFSVLQLSKFAIALTSTTPFPSAKTSIASLFIPILEDRDAVRSRADPVQYNFIRAHAIIFTNKQSDKLRGCTMALVSEGLLATCVTREKEKFKELGAAMALANTAAMLGYGQATDKGVPLGILRLLIEQHIPPRPDAESLQGTNEDDKEQRYTIDSLDAEQLSMARNRLAVSAAFSFKIFSTILKMGPNKNTGPLVHIYLAFLRSLAFEAPLAMAEIHEHVPWSDMANYFNQLLQRSRIDLSRITKQSIPLADQGSKQKPLMEDYSMRGLMFTNSYPPSSLFSEQDSSDEERLVEQASMHLWRVERILFLAHKIASLKMWMMFTEQSKTFTVTGFPRHEVAGGSDLDADEDSPMAESGSETSTLVSKSSSRPSIHYDPVKDVVRGGDRQMEPRARARDKQDIEMADTAQLGGGQQWPELWLDMSAQDSRNPPKFDLQGIEPENYPIKIHGGDDDPDA